MKIKKGDTVIVISGSRKEKGKIGKVIKILREKDMLLVEGVNLRSKLIKDDQGKKKRVKTEYPIHVSNVMFFDPKEKKGTRLGYKVDEKGKKTRYTKKSGTELTN